MNKVSITYIAPRFYPFKAGAEGNLLAMAERMAAEGHEVNVLTTDFKFRDHKPPNFEVYKGIKIYRHKSFIERPIYLAFFPGLLKSIFTTDSEVIHVSGFGFIWIEFCLLLKKICHPKTKFVNTPHGPFMASDKLGKGKRGILKSLYTKYLSILIPWLYDRIISVVPPQKEWMANLYRIKEDQIIMIPNGIDEDYLEKNIVKHSKDDKVVITYLNRMEWYKGIQDVVKALDKINKIEINKIRRGEKTNLPDFEFYIMGKPSGFTETLKELVAKFDIENKVRFVFSPTDNERDDIYKNLSQINILPSKWEAFGIALLEAMAKGNVAITTFQNQGVDLLIKEGKTGFAFDFGDVDRLAEILRELLENYKLRQQIREHNISYAKNFTWEAVFPKYQEMIVSLKYQN